MTPETHEQLLIAAGIIVVAAIVIVPGWLAGWRPGRWLCGSGTTVAIAILALRWLIGRSA